MATSSFMLVEIEMAEHQHLINYKFEQTETDTYDNIHIHFNDIAKFIDQSRWIELDRV